jgi:hypothetical protein
VTTLIRGTPLHMNERLPPATGHFIHIQSRHAATLHTASKAKFHHGNESVRPYRFRKVVGRSILMK